MKKFFSIMLISLCIAALVSCGKQPSPEVTTDRTTSSATATTMGATTATTATTQPTITRVPAETTAVTATAITAEIPPMLLETPENAVLNYIYTDEGTIKTLTFYDSNGNITRYCEYGTSHKCQKELIYGENGNILTKKEYFYTADATLSELNVYEYDEDENCKNVSRYDYSGGELLLSYYTDWDEANGTQSHYFFNNGILYQAAVYDENDDLIKHVTYDGNGLLYFEAYYEYVNGKRITSESIYYNPDGTVKRRIIFGNGRTLWYYGSGALEMLSDGSRETYYNEDGTVNYYAEGRFSYYANGNVRSVEESCKDCDWKVTYYTIDGEVESYITYKEEGLDMVVTEYNAQGEITYVHRYSLVSNDARE